VLLYFKHILLLLLFEVYPVMSCPLRHRCNRVSIDISHTPKIQVNHKHFEFKMATWAWAAQIASSFVAKSRSMDAQK